MCTYAFMRARERESVCVCVRARTCGCNSTQHGVQMRNGECTRACVWVYLKLYPVQPKGVQEALKNVHNLSMCESLCVKGWDQREETSHMDGLVECMCARVGTLKSGHTQTCVRWSLSMSQLNGSPSSPPPKYPLMTLPKPSTPQHP